MNFRGQFQISWVGASLFSGGTVYVYVLMALYSELGVYSYRIIDSQPVYLSESTPSSCFANTVLKIISRYIIPSRLLLFLLILIPYYYLTHLWFVIV